MVPRAAIALALLSAANAAFATTSESTPVRIGVEFFADGRCRVAGDGVDGVERVIDPPPSIDAASDLRCAIRSVPKGRSVDLTVTMPAGAAPSRGDFTRLIWTRRGSQWTGTATLPAAPAFVRVPHDGSAAAARARALDWLALGAAAVAIAWSLRFGAKHG